MSEKVEAMRVEKPYEAIMDWMGNKEAFFLTTFTGEKPTVVAIVIPTLEGNLRAELGDWIIKGEADEFYPCKPDIFEQTYEAGAAEGDDDQS